MAASDPLDEGVGIGIILAILLGLFTEAVIWCFNLNAPPELSLLLAMLAMGCCVPINLYIFSHRMTLPLPTWLTSGRPVAFGGTVSNICGGTEKPYGDSGGDGGWACFPSNVQIWLQDVAGPDGWEHFFQPPRKLVACLIMSAGIILYLGHIVAVLCKPGCLFEGGVFRRRERERREAREQCKSRRQCEKGNHCAEAGVPEIADVKKE